MIKVNFTPKTDIEEYLNNDFNLEIFEDLTENEDWQGTFEPLDFLNLLYEQFEIVNANKKKPLSVVKHLLGLKLEQTKLYYLLYYLKRHIYKHSGSEYEPKDIQLSICRGFIEKEYDKLEAELYPKTEPEPQPEKENKYDFQKVKLHIETLTTVKDKILYLTDIKTDFLQNKSSWDLDLGTPFDRKCELEIKKLNEVLKLEAHTTTPKAKPRLGEYSNSQLVLIFYYFFKYSGIEPRVNTDIAPIAKFLHLITGKEFSNTQSSDFYKKLSKAPNHVSDKSLIDDLNHIKPLFQKVELNEIVKMIDNEIDQCRTAIKETKTGKR
ncbi:hypothetical protein MASR2M12_08830 [Bacteroidales bacterium]